MGIKSFLILFFLLTLIESNACTCDPIDITNEGIYGEYDFIALARIDSIFALPNDKGNRSNIFQGATISTTSVQTKGFNLYYGATISVIELFIGNFETTIVVSGANHTIGNGWTSCDIGIDAKEEWILYCDRDGAGRLRVHFCSPSIMSRNKIEERDWFYERGMKELKYLRNYCGIAENESTIVLGYKELQYSSGQTEVCEYFVDSKREGHRTRFYADGTLMSKEKFKGGKLNGISIWYDRRGYLWRKLNYREDNYVDTCFSYFSHGGIDIMSIYSPTGQRIEQYNFSYKGILEKHYKYDLRIDSDYRTWYHENGAVKRISEYVGRTYKIVSTAEFAENNDLLKEWRYFHNDSNKHSDYKEWNKYGEIVIHKVQLRDSTLYLVGSSTN